MLRAWMGSIGVLFVLDLRVKVGVRVFQLKRFPFLVGKINRVHIKGALRNNYIKITDIIIILWTKI